jgi:hypothetical protein
MSAPAIDSLKTAARQAVQGTVSSKKVADLQRDIADPNSDSRQRTDYGVLIQDTDNWYVAYYDFFSPS